MAWRGVAASLFQVAACLVPVRGRKPAGFGRRTDTGKRASDRAHTNENESPAGHVLSRGRRAIEFPPSTRRRIYMYTRIYACQCVRVHMDVCMRVCCCATVALRTVLSFIEAALGLYLSSPLFNQNFKPFTLNFFFLNKTSEFSPN